MRRITTAARLSLGALLLAALTASASGRSHLSPPLTNSAAVRANTEAPERRRRLDGAARKGGGDRLPAGSTGGAFVTRRRRSATASVAVAATALESISRGGALVYEDDADDDAGLVVSKLRNLVRSLLQVLDRSSPTLASFLKSFVGMLEGVVGSRLLPREKKTETVQRRSSTGKKRKKKRAATTEGDSEDEAVAKKAKSGSTSGAKKRARSSGGAAKKKVAAPAAAKRKKPAGGGQASQHVTKSLKSNNPNYRIQRELKEFLANPPPNLRVAVGKNIRVWIIHLSGTKGSIYEGEKYKLRVSFPPDYPTGPPSVYFLHPTPRHEHVYTNGDICLSLLGKDWRPTMTAQSLANSILSILAGAQRKSLPMDNARHAPNKPGGRQDDWIYHDDNC